MTRINELIINGKSSADFPFTVYVTNNAGYNYAKKKNVLFETTYGTGAIKNKIDAYPPIQKPYSIYCPTATLQDMREVTTWIADEGKLIASDESDVYYEILDVEVSNAPLEATGGYMLDIIFTTMPFGYEHTSQFYSLGNGASIYNHTNAPMYPVVDVYGQTSSEQTVQIGNQSIKLRYINQRLTIESKPLSQAVFDSDGREINSIMSGGFFELKANSTSRITLSSGISRIELRARWAWL